MILENLDRDVTQEHYNAQSEGELFVWCHLTLLFVEEINRRAAYERIKGLSEPDTD